jgi:hypothetical protein
MGVPACLWRRTGEIYKGNREFSELVGVDGYMMRDVSSPCDYQCLQELIPSMQGRLCIYELMAEESAVNYWEVSLVYRITLQLLTTCVRNTVMLPLTLLRRPYSLLACYVINPLSIRNHNRRKRRMFPMRRAS